MLRLRVRAAPGTSATGAAGASGAVGGGGGTGGTGAGLVAQLASTATVRELCEWIAARCDVPSAEQELLVGFPPRPIFSPSTSIFSASASDTLVHAGIRSGDTIVVRHVAPDPALHPTLVRVPLAVHVIPDDNSCMFHAIAYALECTPYQLPLPIDSLHPKSASASTASSATARSHAFTISPPSTTHTSRRVPFYVHPSDVATTTSTSAAAADVPDSRLRFDPHLLDQQPSTTTAFDGRRATALRHAVAHAVRTRPDVYPLDVVSASLERPIRSIDEYCSRIVQPTAWGGALECSVLAELLGLAIVTIDVESGAVLEFAPAPVNGGGVGGHGLPQHAIFLLYSGIHYDCLIEPSIECPCAGASSTSPTPLVSCTCRLFPSVHTDAVRFAQTRTRAELAAARARAVHAFTNTTTFTLRCSICHLALQGAAQASEHAAASGHAAFEEFSA